MLQILALVNRYGGLRNQFDVTSLRVVVLVTSLGVACDAEQAEREVVPIDLGDAFDGTVARSDDGYLLIARNGTEVGEIYADVTQARALVEVWFGDAHASLAWTPTTIEMRCDDVVLYAFPTVAADRDRWSAVSSACTIGLTIAARIVALEGVPSSWVQPDFRDGEPIAPARGV